ncbi:MAG: SpoIIE family protein phosphatase [Candidatus Eisenbacteria bacterium]|nr:SpoIIE family protein phosphatase [Candidatus Eisenbacteria bacterium]
MSNQTERPDSSSIDRYRTLLEAVKTITSTLNVETILERLLYLTHRILGFEYCTILLIGRDGETLDVAARYGYPDSIVQSVELKVGKGLTGRVAQTGQPIVVPDVSVEDRYLDGLRGARSELVVPMVFRGRVIGVVDVQSPELDAFSPESSEFLSALAAVASVAIINARNHEAAIASRDEALKRRELEHQINLGRTIQERLLPESDPLVEGYEIAGMNLPSQTISGDYFDYIELPNGHLGIAVADVSGKGIPAALLAAALQGTLRSHVENLYSISTIMQRANNALARSTPPDTFATLFYGVLDPSGELTYVNAGHNPPILLRDDGTTERLTTGGTVLGMFAGAVYKHDRVRFRPEEYLVIFTDGLSESQQGDELFGDGRVIETARRARGAPARVMASLLITEADAFAGAGTPVDDMTVVVARRLAG